MNDIGERHYANATPRRVAFLGLGVMGHPMAVHLLRAGHQVTVYNRTQEKAERWVETHGGAMGRTPREAAQDADVVMMCLGNDDDVRAVVLGPQGVLGEDTVSGAIIVDHTTTSATLARALHKEARARGVHFVDAPVSGGQSGAKAGQLTVMCGATEDAFSEVKPVVEAFAKSVVRIGEPGDGQLAKMVNQICSIGIIQSLAEGLAFGRAAGLDMPHVLNAIDKGVAQSWLMDHRAQSMLEDRFDFGFAVDLMRKDLGLVLDEARKNGARLPIAALVDQFFADLQKLGGGRWDTSSLMRRLR